MTGHTPYLEITHKGGIPTDAAERKAIPVYSGFMVYFPLAICEVAKLSRRGNDQHNPGTDLHWDRSKSKDEQDSAARHMLGTAVAESIDDEIEHATAQAWRSMANLEKLCDKRLLQTDKRREFQERVDGGEDEVRGHTFESWSKGQTERVYQNPDFKNSESKKIADAPQEACGGQPETYRYRAPINDGMGEVGPEKSRSGRIVVGEDA